MSLSSAADEPQFGQPAEQEPTNSHLHTWCQVSPSAALGEVLSQHHVALCSSCMEYAATTTPAVQALSMVLHGRCSGRGSGRPCRSWSALYHLLAAPRLCEKGLCLTCLWRRVDSRLLLCVSEDSDLYRRNNFVAY